jgi:hypothetical protein
MPEAAVERDEDRYAALGLRFWGSECTDCWNATPDSMQCDSCKSTLHTTELWVSAKAIDTAVATS